MLTSSLLAGIVLASPPLQETVVLRTSEGALLEARLDKPSGREKAPSVVVCQGREGDRTAPFVVRTASAALAMGALALTFDWHFTVVASRPSVGYEVERDTLDTIVRHLRIHPRSDGRVVFVGAGIGAEVAAQVFLADPRLTGLVMVDPPPIRPREAEALLRALDESSRPVVLLSSDPLWAGRDSQRVRAVRLGPEDDRIPAAIEAVKDVLRSGGDGGTGT